MNSSQRSHAASPIELRLREVAQLFNSFDPSPFYERDLDDDAVEHIVGWARELPAREPIALLVHLPLEEVRKARERGIAEAISAFFADRATAVERDLRELFRVGLRYFVVGVAVLVSCLVASQLVRTNFGTGAFSRSLEEGLIILGWVANWKPLETFLYDWWPLKRRRDLFRRISNATIEIRAE